MREPISPELRNEVLKRDNYACRYCGTKKEPFHLDHVYPVVKGGETSYDNLVTSCVHCNSKKHSSIGMWPKPIGYFEEKPKKNPVSILTVFIFAVGVSFVSMGFDNLLHGYLLLSEVFTLIGLSSCFIGLGRITTLGR